LEGYGDYGSEVVLDENSWRPYYEKRAVAPLRYSRGAEDCGKKKRRSRKEDPAVAEVAD
jgi:hypothetical protein